VTELDLTPVPGRPNLLLGAYDLATLGYRADEFFVSGSASSYAPVADFGPTGGGARSRLAPRITPRALWP
jgi:hypothetical protein